MESMSANLVKALFPMEKAVRFLGVSISGFFVEESDTLALWLSPGPLSCALR
jgi:hypothetical protein